MSRSRLLTYFLLIAVLVGGVATAADALVVSEEESLSVLVEGLTEGTTEERVDVLMGWTDPSREQVRLSYGDRARRLSEESAFELSEALALALEPISSPDQELVQQSVNVDDEHATLAFRTRGSDGLHDTTLTLVRDGQGWLVSRLRIR